MAKEDYAAKIEELLELKAQQLVMMLKAELGGKDQAQAEIKKELKETKDHNKQLEDLLGNDCEGCLDLARNHEVLKRAYTKAKARIRYLEATLDAVGADEQGEDWYWPYYQHEAPTVMMRTELWISARKQAAELLSKCIKGQVKTKNSGQDLKG